MLGSSRPVPVQPDTFMNLPYALLVLDGMGVWLDFLSTARLEGRR